MRLLLIVTLFARTITQPVMSRFWMTAPGVEIVMPTDGVSTVPAGTPVFVGPGHVALGTVVAVVDGAAVVGGVVMDESVVGRVTAVVTGPSVVAGPDWSSRMVAGVGLPV